MAKYGSERVVGDRDEWTGGKLIPQQLNPSAVQSSGDMISGQVVELIGRDLHRNIGEKLGNFIVMDKD